jgi:TonB-dependent receptor
VDWTLTAAGVGRTEPDRADLVYVQFRDTDGSTYWGLPVGDPEGLRRTFGDLSENNYSAGANFRRTMGAAERSWDLRFGGLYRFTDRDARNFQFSVVPQQLPAGAHRMTPEEIFGLAASGDGRFRVSPSNDAGSYLATEHLGAGYAMAELPLGPRVRLITGARVESASLTLDTELTGGQQTRLTRNDVDVLPSVVVNVALSEDQALRFSATQTLARPEYRELSPFAYLEVIGGEITKGNENLGRSLIRNLDAKWELYPSAGEVLSVGVFAKQFDRPIERVDVATGGPPQVTFVNSESAFNVGAEVEVRSRLARLTPALEPFSVFGNVTVMNSEISLADGISANTNGSRPMIGQAPYVVNLGLNFAPRQDATATLLYNVAGRRIWAAGSVPFPDTYEEPRGLLDLSLRFPLPGSMSGRFDARNLLDSPFVLQQGPVERLRYNSGRVFSIGLTWAPSL